MTVKSTMHQMLRRFEWSVPKNYRLQLTWGTGPMPADDLPIDMRARAQR
ncbi:cytochrome P450 [Mycolicibacterium fortuitum]|uniref:Cytochrome P450 n=1 Tax=Mycolicibacterium fortuitum TaxID=1766 RepID=A0A378UX00_MYCFO|nr:cytochrome P450 [Mycolicibacterium fortuitum]